MMRAFKDRLGFRLVFYTLVVSAVVSSIAAAIQLYLSYQQQSDAALEVLNRVEISVLAPLENALWRFDLDQVETILSGVQADSTVAHVLLTSPTGHTFEYGEVNFQERPSSFDLISPEPGSSDHIGTLTVYLSLENVWSNLITQFLTLLATNLAKTWIVAVAILAIFYRLVTRHIYALANVIDRTSMRGQPLFVELDRPANPAEDALDKITIAFNDLTARSHEHVTRLDREIEQRKKAEQDALNAVVARKSFLANMSHEVRTPLNAIMGLFQLVDMTSADPKIKKHAAMGLAAGQGMLGQLNNVLEVSRIEANSLTFKQDWVSLSELLETWREIARGAVRKYDRNIEVFAHLDGFPSDTVLLDHERVTQIVLNLCDNAAKFTSSGKIDIFVGHVLKSGMEGGGVEISVSDTGCGISEQDKGVIFERFSQIDTSITRSHSGTGLGLSICRDLAEMMGGQLSVESPSSCAGYATTFTFIVPGCVQLRAGE